MTLFTNSVIVNVFFNVFRLVIFSRAQAGACAVGAGWGGRGGGVVAGVGWVRGWCGRDVTCDDIQSVPLYVPTRIAGRSLAKGNPLPIRLE